jgi:hypothetical protein
MANGAKENHKMLKCIDDDGATVCRASICSEKNIVNGKAIKKKKKKKKKKKNKIHIYTCSFQFI